jgi:hypothetical protein
MSAAIVGKVAVKVIPDTGDFKTRLKRDLEKVEKSLRIKVPTSADMTGAHRDALQGVREINAQMKAHAVRLRTTVDESSLRQTAAEVERMRDRLSPLKVETKVDTKGLSKFLRFLSNIGASAAKFAAVGAAVGGIAALSLSAASNLAALSVSLASIAPAALALPGLLVGIGLGLGATVIALKDFGKVFPDVKAKLSELRTAISDNFWDRAKAPVREFVDVLLPQFAAGMSGIATNLGSLFGDLATSLKGSLDGAIGPMFARLGESIDIARGATDALAGTIATLGQVGADYLPRLSQWFVDLTIRFDAFLSGAAADGRLKGWIDTGIQALRDLGAVLGGLGGIFYGIGTAAVAAGGSVLGTLGAALQRVSDVVNSEPFQTGLTAVFAAAHEALNRIATLSGPGVSAFFQSLSTLLPTLLPIVGDALGTALGAVAEALSSVAVQTAVVTLFEALRAAVEALAPVLTGLTGFLSNHTRVAKVLAIAIGTIVVAAYTALAISSAVTTTKVVASNLAIAGSAAATAAKTVASWARMVAAFVAGTASLVASVATKVAAYALLAARAALNAAKVVASWVAMAAGAVASAAVHVAQVGVMVAKWAFLGAQALLHGAKVAAAWLLALGPIGIVIAAVVAAVALIVANWDTVVRVTKAAWEKVQAATSAAWGAVKSAVSAAVDFIVGLFLNFTVPGLVIKHWETIKDAFSSGAQAVIGFVRGLPGEIAGVFGNAGSILTGAGRQIIDGLISGIRSAFGRVKDTLSSLTSMLPNWKGPAKRDRVLLFDAGKLIIGGLVDGLESQYGNVRKTLTSLTRTIGSTTIPAPQLVGPHGGMSAQMQRAMTTAQFEGPTVTVNKSFHYTVNGGTGVGEEDLFSALSSARAHHTLGW